nr:uncharacterized protein LOC109736878 [Aegilops tauschii subsp. strangulata]XP_040253553.1 uncharacterized protein LOC120970755 [Aegilops tauschii subsp. strangulata]
MPSWKDGEESSDEEELVGMDLEQHWANPDTTIDPSFCGRAADASITCRLHLAPCMKYVAFEGKDTGRRFYGCVVPQVSVIKLGFVLVVVSLQMFGIAVSKFS